MIAAPHGVDLGPLQPRLPDGLRTPTGMIDVAPQPILDDLPRMEAALRRSNDGFVLVGRRDLRSNNSWMHNVEVLVKGKPRCVLHVHPDDASSVGLADGGQAKVPSRVGTIVVPVEVTEGIRPGVVSLPHGWGHDLPDIELDVAARHAGVNSNLLTDDSAVRRPHRHRRAQRHPRGAHPGVTREDFGAGRRPAASSSSGKLCFPLETLLPAGRRAAGGAGNLAAAVPGCRVWAVPRSRVPGPHRNGRQSRPRVSRRNRGAITVRSRGWLAGIHPCWW